MTAPRSVVLGADAWAVLRQAAPALLLPEALAAGPPLTADQARAAEEALRRSQVVPGATGDLREDLHPSVRASLLLHVVPAVVVDTLVGLGPAVRTGRFAAAGPLASGLLRTGPGPVTLTTAPVEALAGLVADQLPDLGAAPAGDVVRLDAAVALAASGALSEGRPDLAAELLAGPVPAALGPLRATALVLVGGAAGRQGLLCVQADDGWRTARLASGDLVLRPLGRDGLVTDLAAALGGALTAAAGA